MQGAGLRGTVSAGTASLYQLMQIWDELSALEILKESDELFQECFISTLKLKKEKLGTGLNVLKTE